VLYSAWLSGDKSHAAGPLGLLTSEFALDRTPGNQLRRFFLSAVPGGLPSPASFNSDCPWSGLDTARRPSASGLRTSGGWADTLRPRGFAVGDGCRGWSLFGCSFALDGGWSGEGLLLSALLALRGVACVAVTAGMRGGVARTGMSVASWGGGGGGGEEGMAGAL
jgi:hypothetical protein